MLPISSVVVLVVARRRRVFKSSVTALRRPGTLDILCLEYLTFYWPRDQRNVVEWMDGWTSSNRTPSKRESATDAEIARHASRGVPPERKTPHFLNLGSHDPTMRFAFGMQLAKIPTCLLRADQHFVSHYIWSQSTNVTDGRTNERTDGRTSCS